MEVEYGESNLSGNDCMLFRENDWMHQDGRNSDGSFRRGGGISVWVGILLTNRYFWVEIWLANRFLIESMSDTSRKNSITRSSPVLAHPASLVITLK